MKLYLNILVELRMAQTWIDVIKNHWLRRVWTFSHGYGYRTDEKNFEEFRGVVSICEVRLFVFFEGFENRGFVSF